MDGGWVRVLSLRMRGDRPYRVLHAIPLRDAAALGAYLRDHAPAMRAEGVARFGDRFGATRRVMAAVDGA